MGNALRRFDIYVLRQQIMLFGFFALVLVLIYWINRAVRLFDQVISDGHTARVFVELSLLSLPPVIQLITPIAAFIATVYVINRLSSESELVVIQSTGFSAAQMMRPVMFFGILVGAFMMCLTHYLEPLSKRQLQIRQSEVSQNTTARLLADGQFMHPRAGTTFYLGEISPEGELLNVFLSDDSDLDVGITYIAKRAFLVRSDSGPKLVLIDGQQQRFDKEEERLSITRFNDFVIDISDFVKSVPARTQVIDHMSTLELIKAQDQLRNPQAVIMEIQARNLKAALVLIAVLIGYATLITAGFSRFGIWRHVFLSVLLLILIKMVEGMAVNFVRANPNFWIMMYAPFGVGMIIVTVQILYSDLPWRRSRGVS